MTTTTPIAKALDSLKKVGYTADFNLRNNCLYCHGNDLELHSDEFQVDRQYRFEALSDPDDRAVVYAISSAKHDVKGILVNGFGTLSEAMGPEMVEALRENPALSAAPEQTPAPAQKPNEAPA